MKVVVTGASGSVGTALLRSPATEDWQVVGVARRPPAPVRPYDRAEWVACDVGAPGAEDVLTEVCADATAVVHLAWAIQPRTDEPDQRRTNVTGTAAVFSAVARAGVGRLVCASSVAAYSPAGDDRVTEHRACDGVPGSAYSAGKARLERMLADFAAGHPAVRVGWVRPCAVVQAAAAEEIVGWVLGPWPPRRLAGLRWTPVPLWSGVRAQFVHADDVATLLGSIVARRAAGPFNAAAEPVLSAAEVAGVLGGFRVPAPRWLVTAVAWLSWRAGLTPAHPGWLALTDRAALVDTGRARTELGWRPVHGGVEALTELVDAVRSGTRSASPALAGRRGRGRPTHQTQSTQGGG
jgi:nucleoside-diphosphate-sugar epimerase